VQHVALRNATEVLHPVIRCQGDDLAVLAAEELSATVDVISCSALVIQGFGAYKLLDSHSLSNLPSLAGSSASVDHLPRHGA
jgi:hypothetical protein